METIKGIKYTILAEESLIGNSLNSVYKTMLILVRPNGNKKFHAMRRFDGSIDLL